MKKNVMVILCDQLRPDFLSCYNQNSPVKTPNIDALSEDGVLFERAVTVSPVCAPARASIMTGRYVSDHKVWTNDVPFRDGIEYLPQLMRENGYACGAFGKLHHFPKRDSKGFEVAWLMEENRLSNEDDYFKFLKEKHNDIDNVFNFDENDMFPFDADEYYESQIAKRAVDFIEENKTTRPFFTWVSFQGPHSPMDPPQFDYHVSEVFDPETPDFDPLSEVPRYRKSRNNMLSTEEIKRYRLDYCKMIEFIDFKIGEIIKYLKDNQLYDNTTIIFSADHGELCGDYNMREKGPFLYKAQLEIPLIVSNHDNLPQNVHSDMLTGNLDLASTCLKIAGIQKPLGYSRAIDVMWNNESYQRKNVYSEFCDSVKIVSNKEYRFAYYPFTKECELVKIEEECVNLANRTEYIDLKESFYQDIIDFMILSKGVEIEAQDLTPKVQVGLSEKFPEYKSSIPLAFPIASMGQINRLKEDNLDSTYNEFCKSEHLVNYYGRYWDE